MKITKGTDTRKWVYDKLDELSALRAENERLREALDQSEAVDIIRQILAQHGEATDSLARAYEFIESLEDCR